MFRRFGFRNLMLRPRALLPFYRSFPRSFARYAVEVNFQPSERGSPIPEVLLARDAQELATLVKYDAKKDQIHDIQNYRIWELDHPLAMTTVHYHIRAYTLACELCARQQKIETHRNAIRLLELEIEAMQRAQGLGEAMSINNKY